MHTLSFTPAELTPELDSTGGEKKKKQSLLLELNVEINSIENSQLHKHM
jgi:hypothetical protein